ncbi:hypothetical protein SAMN02745823_03624 [Sporobacter termitidis DSM 10068]|uniref:Peptidase M10 metallopeptidase domain-containing protein n=1 Tax=Sporobacter termitidis DSM 10068 TaxID=1123282 RepID=A0A1M5ZEN4_9FIRM|nr:matrixin family metalloprotease [Sporobacter termitidis]SHI22678.1 hypothetical protein SAMN02745823_03624 [Sporobacter termitidis DSM 10068]
MKKRTISLLLTLAMTVVIFTGLGGNAEANYYPNNYKNIFGLNNRQYVIGASASSYPRYLTAISTAVNAWNAASKVQLYASGSGSSAVVFSVSSLVSLSERGQTIFYTIDGSPMTTPTSSWSYAEVRISQALLNSMTEPATELAATVMHEMGHAFGLTHAVASIGQVSIMLPYADRRGYVTTVLDGDLDDVDNLYP